jgi:hypothetical protein
LQNFVCKCYNHTWSWGETTPQKLPEKRPEPQLGQAAPCMVTAHIHNDHAYLIGLFFAFLAVEHRAGF